MKKIIILGLILFIQTQTMASDITYKATLEQAIDNSFDLKMSEVDIGISRAQLKAIRADWYPTLSMQFNTEYNKDLADGRGYYAYAGTTMITPYTQFRDMMYLTLSYNLFDFGIQGKKVDIAKQELAQKVISYNLQLKDLKLKILELYSKAQQYNNSINMKTEVLLLYNNMFRNKERMFKAGINDKLSVMDEAVKIAKTQHEIENSKLELKTTLQDLSNYTKIEYSDIPNLTFGNINAKNIAEESFVDINFDDSIKTGIEENAYNFSFDPYLTEESQYYDLEIEKKKSELSILKRQLLPSFKFYVGYSLYGQNPQNYWASIQDVAQRSFLVGISSQYVFFDGFKNRANREKIKLEIEKLKLEKEKKLCDLENKYKKSYNAYETYNEELIINQELLLTVKEKVIALNRLKASKLVEQNEILSAKAELLNQECELEQNIINITAKLEELKIMSGTDL